MDGQDVFNYAWITALLDKMLAEVQAQCVRRDMSLHWTLFYERVVQPITEGRAPPALTELCARYDVAERPQDVLARRVPDEPKRPGTRGRKTQDDGAP